MRQGEEQLEREVVGAKKHYWLREDFDHLMGLLPMAHHESPSNAKSSTSLNYPKNIEGAFRELRMRGLQCDAADLMRLVEEKVVRPEGELSALQWSKEDIDVAAEWLYENQRWNSWTHFCWTANLRYGQCVKAYRVACARYGIGFTLSFDVLGLVTLVEPGETADDYAYVRFFPKGMNVEPQEEDAE